MTYNPYQDVYRIAVGCLYLHLHKAILDFPGSTVASPSEWVTVSRTTGTPVRDGDDRYFPFQVRWYLWEEVVVPVLRDPEQRLETVLLGNQHYDQVIDWLIGVLSEQLAAKGFIPALGLPSPLSAPGMVEADQVEGDVNPNPLAVDLGAYPPTDPTILWPEGHPRLTYPVVE